MEKVFYDVNGEPYPHDSGTSVAWRVSGYVLVERGGEFLFIKQPYCQKFELPGGGLAPDEDLLSGVQRECLEETGFHVVFESNAPIAFHDSFFYNADESPYFFHSLAIFYKAKIDDLAQERGEAVDVCWLHPNDINEEQVQAMHLKAYRSTEA